MLIPGPIVSVLFERGAFGPADTAATALAVAIYGAGLPAFVLQKVISPVYYAREDTRTPFRFAVHAMIVNVVVALGLAPLLGFVAAALGTTVAGWVMLFQLWRGARAMGEAAAPDARLRRACRASRSPACVDGRRAARRRRALLAPRARRRRAALPRARRAGRARHGELRRRGARRSAACGRPTSAPRCAAAAALRPAPPVDGARPRSGNNPPPFSVAPERPEAMTAAKFTAPRLLRHPAVGQPHARQLPRRAAPLGRDAGRRHPDDLLHGRPARDHRLAGPGEARATPPASWPPPSSPAASTRRARSCSTRARCRPTPSSPGSSTASPGSAG